MCAVTAFIHCESQRKASGCGCGSGCAGAGAGATIAVESNHEDSGAEAFGNGAVDLVETHRVVVVHVHAFEDERATVLVDGATDAVGAGVSAREADVHHAHGCRRRSVFRIVVDVEGAAERGAVEDGARARQSGGVDARVGRARGPLPRTRALERAGLALEGADVFRDGPHVVGVGVGDGRDVRLRGLRRGVAHEARQRHVEPEKEPAVGLARVGLFDRLDQHRVVCVEGDVGGGVDQLVDCGTQRLAAVEGRGAAAVRVRARRAHVHHAACGAGAHSDHTEEGSDQQRPMANERRGAQHACMQTHKHAAAAAA